MKFELRRYQLTIMILFLILRQTSADNVQLDTAKINLIVREWSIAHNTHDLNKMNQLYASKVLFYCLELSKDECIKRKFKLLESGSTFNQRIVSPITHTLFENDIIKCDFTKEVLFKGSRKNYPSYLLIKKEDGEFFIIGESDKITDINLKYNLKLGPQIKLSQPLESSVVTIKRTEKVYILFAVIIFIVILLIFYNRKRLFIYRNKREKVTNINIDIKTNLGVLNKNKGDEFEMFVVQKFDKRYFTLLNWRSDKGIGGIFPESNKYPDLEYQFNCNNYSKDFAVECKFRQEPKSGIIEIAYNDQLIRYRSFQSERKMKVYVVLGLGGTPNSPKSLYLIPLDKIATPKMSIGSIEQFNKTLSSNFFFSMAKHELS